MNFLQDLWQYSFLQHAFIGGILAAIGCGIIGPYVVVKRISFMAGGIAHSLLGGMGISYFFWQDPAMGAIPTALILAIIIGLIHLYGRQQEDILIAAIWSMGMATGVIFISQTPGYAVDMMSYLFGNILFVETAQLYQMLGLDLVLLLVVALFYRPLQAVTFDPEFARLRGVPVTFFYLLLLCLVALTVVLLMPMVGLILVIALLALPAAIARLYVTTLKPMMLLATLLGLFFSSFGLYISHLWNLPTGACIILVAGLCYIFALGGRALWHYRI